MNEKDQQFYVRVTDLLKEACSTCSFQHDEFTVTLDSLSQLVRCVTFLRDHQDCSFSQLIDMTAVDYPSRPKRFEMVYHFLSMNYNKRLRMKVLVNDGEVVPSITSVFQAAGWYEREVFDLYGIVFQGHPDLRRILTDYNFDGFPLRKDFPLTGYVEVRYDDTIKKVLYEPVVLPQAFRTFDTMSPWEGMLQGALEGYTFPLEDDVAHTLLPGDEKALKGVDA
ncbi:MAG: NADH-quinone oxidoreductase subunit C [Alphaproteobacteria bacterium]|nr:NADH-quinone oxidoreductase subunit C [Alphaproteobacteria bacterium]